MARDTSTSTATRHGTKSEPPATTKPAERLSPTTAPMPRRDVGLAWLVLAGLLLIAAVPLLIDLDRAAAWSEKEAVAVAIAVETHQRKDPLAETQTSLDAWTPVYEGVSRWDLPPGGVWLHQVMFVGVSPAPDGAAAEPSGVMLFRARLGSVLMAMLLIAAVYWSGHSIGGVTTGTLSAIVAMTMPLLIGFGRHATADVAASAWAALSIAGALWAMRPLRASPSLPRQLIGWMVCGFALGLAALAAGPRAVPTTLLCTIVLAMICPRRVGHIMGLIASSVIAALLLTPWALHAHGHDPNVWQQWVNALTPDLAQVGLVEALGRAGWRLSLAATLAGLWLVWLIPAVTQPFSTSTGAARRRLLLGWAWLITAAGLVAFAPGPTRLSTTLTVVAPASVCIGLTIQQFHDLSAEGRHARLWLVCRWIMVGFMAVLGAGLPLLGYLIGIRSELVLAMPDLREPLMQPMHWSYYAGTAAALVLATALAIRFALGHHPGRTAACLALWLLTLYTLGTMPIARGPLLNTPAAAQTTEQPLAP